MRDDETFRKEYLCQYCEDANRNSGRTTAIALRLIADAVGGNGQWFQARDHYDGASGQINLRNVVQDIAKGAGLDIETRLMNRSRGGAPFRAVEVRSNRKKAP